MSGKPEIHRVDPDVHDPAGGDRLVIAGKFATVSEVRVGVTPINGMTTEAYADFDGTNDRLTNATTVTNLLSLTGYWWWAVVYVEKVVSNVTTLLYTDGDTIWNDMSGYVGGFIGGTNRDTLYCYHWDSAARYATAVVPKDQWCLVQCWHDGTDVRMSVNGVEGTSAAAGAIGAGSGTLKVGENYSGADNWFNGRIAELGFRDVVSTAADRANLAGYVSKRYGISTGTPPSAFDPASWSLTGWWRSGSYTSGTWTPTASAGTSGSNGNLAEATNPPAVITTPTGFREPMAGTADFDGTNDKLLVEGTIADYYSVTAYSGWALVWVDKSSTDSATGYMNDCILAAQPSAYWSLYVRSSGLVGVDHYDGTHIDLSTSFPTSPGWHLIQWKLDGGTLKIRVDGGTRATLAAGAGGWPAVDMVVGQNYAPDQQFDGRIAELALTNIALSDGTEDSVLGYINKRYGLSLGGVAPSTYDPSGLVLKGWWRSGGYVSGTWTGTASAGSSGTQDLTEATNPPAVATSSRIVCTAPAGSAGSTVSAFPDFDGTNDRLLTTLDSQDFVSNAAGSIGVLFFARAADTAEAANSKYTERAFFIDDNGNFSFTYSTDGVSISSYNGTNWNSASAAAAVGSWHYAQGRWNGTTKEVRVDGGVWVSVTHAVAGLAASSCYVGTDYDQAEFLNASLLDMMLESATWSDAEADSILGYINKRYGLALGGVSPNAYDPAVRSLTGWWRSGDYVSGTWTGTASAGTSGGRDLTEATNPPAVARSFTARTFHPVSVKNGSGRGCLSRAIQYANPSTLPDCVLWMRPDDADTTRNGSVEATTIVDKSGVSDANRDFTIPGTDAPAWNSADTDYGGKPTIGTFKKAGIANDCQIRTGVWSKTYDEPYSLGIIGHRDSGYAGNIYFTHEGGTDYNSVMDSGGTPRAYGYNATPTISVSGFLANKRSLMLATFNGATNSMFTCEAERATGDLKGAGPGGTLGDAGFGAGSYSSSATSYGAEKLAEVYAYSRAISLRDVRTLRRYRDSYYGPVAAT